MAKRVTPAKQRTKATRAAKTKRTPRTRPTTKTAHAKRATPARATQAPMFQRIAFTMFSVEDAARARDFYENVLGFTRGLASPNGVWTEYDLPGGGCLALFRHPDPAFVRAGGGASVAFEVADLDALNRRLIDAGVRYQGDMVHGPHCRMSNIVDTEGNAIILHELNPVRPAVMKT